MRLSSTKLSSARLLIPVLVVIFMLQACLPTNQGLLLEAEPTRSLTDTPDGKTLLTRVAAAATPTLEPTSTPFPQITVTPTSVPELISSSINPLTGLPVTNPSRLPSRPLLVKVANWPANLRPSVGLNQADMVFEYYIGHQMNHFLALFYGTDAAVVGPLAPARLPDFTFSRQYQSNIAVASLQPADENLFENQLPGRVFQRGFVDCPAICTESLAQGGNTVVNTTELNRVVSTSNPGSFVANLTGNIFAESAPLSQEMGSSLSIIYADFSVTNWRYDQSTSRYHLWQDAQLPSGKYTLSQSLDRDSQQPITFDNIIVLYSTYLQYSDSRFDIDLRIGDDTQQAMLFRDGKLVHARWYVTDEFSPIRLTDQNNAPSPLKPGTTWMVFVSRNTRSQQINEGEWELTFSIN